MKKVIRETEGYKEKDKMLSVPYRNVKLVLVILVTIIGIVALIAGLYIRSVSIVGTVVTVYSKDSSEIRVVTEQCGLGDYEVVTLSYQTTSLYRDGEMLKEGDRVWAICDTFVDLSDPPTVYAKAIFRRGVVTGSEYEEIKARDSYCVELPESIVY